MKASIYSDVWRGGDADAPVVDRVTYCNVTAMAQMQYWRFSRNILVSHESVSDRPPDRIKAGR